MASLALVTQDTAHGAATNTKTALEAIGHTVTLVADSGITTHDFSGYAAVLAVRAQSTSTVANKLRNLMDSDSKPVVVGPLFSGVTAGTGKSSVSTRMHLTGTMTVLDNTSGLKGCTVVDNTHYLAAPFGLGDVLTHSAGNFWAAVTSGQSYVGDVICNGLAGSTLAGLPETLAIAAGTNDLQGTPVATGARCVVLGSLYGGQSAYTEDGKTLLARAINWVLSLPTATNRVTGAALRVLVTPSAAATNRVTGAALRILVQSTCPRRPTITVAELPGAFFVQTSAFQAAHSTPLDEHTQTTYQLTDTGDPTFAAPLFEFVFDAPSPQIVEALFDGLGGLTTYLVRARHTGGLGGDSDWSESVEATTLDDVIRPTTPTITVLAVETDGVTAKTSNFAHAEGVTTQEAFDPENPLPYLLAVHWQVRHVSTGAVVIDTGLMPPSDPMYSEVSFWDLVADTAYQIRALHFDGKYDAASQWSAWVAFSTDEIPPIRPVAPDVTVTTCGKDGTVALSCTAFSHPEPAATHQATRWRMTLGSSAPFFVTTTVPGELLAFEFTDLDGGVWTFDAAHQDDSGRWGLFGGTDTCTVLEKPGTPEFDIPSGKCITAATLIGWDMPDVPAGTWRYHGEVSGDDGATWTQVFTDQAAATYTFPVAGKAYGTWIFRVRACHEGETVCGDYAYLLLTYSATCREGVFYDFSQYATLPLEWEVLWDQDVTWEPVNCALGSGGGYGILATNPTTYTQRKSILAFTELGELSAYEATCEFSILAQYHVGYAFRFAHTEMMRGGLAHRARGEVLGADRSGVISTVSCGVQPEPCPPGGGVHDGLGGFSCNEECLNPYGLYCYRCPGEYARLRDVFPDYHHQYAVGKNQGWLRQWGYHQNRSVHYFMRYSSIQHAGTKTRGLEVQHIRGDSCLPCSEIRPRYTLRQRVTRTVTGGSRIQSKVFGPGLDPTSGWDSDETYTSAQVQQIECGYVGLALEHFASNLTPNESIVFFSFGMTNPEYDECDPPPPPPDPGEAEILEKAWAFVLDGHTFYVLNRASDPAIVCDIKTGQWHMWRTKYPALSGIYGDHWNMFRGIMWKGRVIAADRDESYVWELDPHSFNDEGAFSIERAVTGYQPCRGSHSKRQGSFRITARREDREEVTKVVMRFSDDAGKTWSNDYEVMFDEASYSKRIEYRSLGRIRAPGRIWEIEDAGGLVRIEGADSDTEGDE